MSMQNLLQYQHLTTTSTLPRCSQQTCGLLQASTTPSAAAA